MCAMRTEPGTGLSGSSSIDIGEPCQGSVSVLFRRQFTLLGTILTSS